MMFTIEEIYLIRSCNSKNKTKIIDVLEGYLKSTDFGMVEMADNALAKLKDASDKEFLELINYPL